MGRADAVTAARIVAARKLCGTSQKNLALEIGVHPVTVSRWESGDYPVPLDQLDAIAATTEVTIDFLLGRVDEPEATIEDRASVAVGDNMVPINLVLTMLEFRERLTPAEFDILRDDLDPAVNPDADQAATRTRGQWYDRICELRESARDRARADRARGSVDGGEPDVIADIRPAEAR